MSSIRQEPLISLARAAFDTASTPGREIMTASPSEWSKLLAGASVEGIDGLLHNWLSRGGYITAVPPELRDRLLRIRAHRLLDYQIKLGATEELLCLTEQSGLSLMVLQGMAIADELYIPGTRPLSDVDFLVRPEEFDRTEQLLISLGYTAVSRYPPVYARNGVSIDLHRHLAYLSRVEPAVSPLRIDGETVWADAVTRPFGPATAWKLSPRDQVIILCAHLQKHSFSRLIWFVDIGLLLNRLISTTPFETVRIRAAGLGLDQPLYLVCAYLRHVLALPSLRSVSLPPQSLTWAERQLAALLMKNKRIDGMGDLLYLLSIQPARVRRQFLYRTMFPQTDMMREEVGSPSAVGVTWGYFSRLSRVAWRVIRLAWRLAWRFAWQ
jgi:Uncharacterised nucleotidyltransferase